MSTYFAFRASAGLQKDTTELLDNFDRGVTAPQYELFIRVSNAFADDVIQNLLLNMVHNMEGESFSAKIMDKLAGVIKATVHVLVRQTLNKKSNEELTPLLKFVLARRLIRQENGADVDYVCFPLPVDLADRFSKIFHHVRDGQVESQRMLLRDAMLDFSDLANFHFYREPTDLMKLGFIARKAVDLGGSTIHSGSHSSIKQIYPQLSHQELLMFCEYFDGMLIEV